VARHERAQREGRTERPERSRGLNDTRILMNMMVASATIVAVPAIARAVPDAELLDLQQQIFEAHEGLESKEHDRLVTLAKPHQRCELIERMWTIPATTPEGRQTKFIVLLDYVTWVAIGWSPTRPRTGI
jgi:hypothetical protein